MMSLAYGALWLFVFSVPWERIIVLPGISIVSRVAGMLALGLALLAVVTSGRIRRWHGMHVAALLFVVWAGCVLLILHVHGIPSKYYTFVQLFSVLWMIWEIATSERRLRGLLTAYLFGAYVAALGTVVAYRTHSGGVHRFSAGGADPNDLAMTLALGLPIAWYLGMTYRQPILRWICRAYLPVALVAIGLTGSRGGMVVTVVALMFVPLTMTKLSPARLAAAAVTLGLSGALAVAYVPDTLVQRFESTGTEVEDMRFGGRFKLWVAGVHAFEQRPLVGYGTSAFIAAITPELGQESQVAHNSFLSVLVEEGTVGLLLYLMIFVAVFLSLVTLPSFERRFTLVLFTTLVVAMLPLTWEDHKIVWFMMAVLVGLSRVLGAVAREPLPHPYVAAVRPLATSRPPGRLAPRPSAYPIQMPRP
jgi:O-antigen ligase